MFCTRCGNQMDKNSVFCPVCGTRADIDDPTAQQQTYSQQSYPQQQQYQQPYSQQPYQQSYQQPYAQQPYQQQSPYQQSAYQTPKPKEESAALVVCALVFAFIIPLVGLILGIIGLVKYKRNYRGMCVAATVISAVLIAISLAIVIPAFMSYMSRVRSLKSNNKSSNSLYEESCAVVQTIDTGCDVSYGCEREFDAVIGGELRTVSFSA